MLVLVDYFTALLLPYKLQHTSPSPSEAQQQQQQQQQQQHNNNNNNNNNNQRSLLTPSAVQDPSR